MSSSSTDQTARTAGVAAWLALTLFAMLQLAWMRDPLGDSLDADIAAGYTLYSCRGEEMLPFSIHRGHWSLLAEREGEVLVPYLHHPPLGLFLMEVVHGSGDGIVPLRAASFGLALALLAAFWFLLRPFGSWFASGSLALLATAGAVLAHGSQASPPLFGMALCMGAIACWWQRGPGLAYCVFAFLAALADWNAFGVVPALWLAAAWKPELGGRRLAAMLRVAVPWLAGILFLGWHMQDGAHEAGGFADVLALIEGSLGLQGRGIDQLLWQLGTHTWDLYGASLVLCGLAGVVLCLFARARQQASALEVLSLVLWVAALVPALVFLSRSATHPFWVLLFAPPLALSTVIALRWMLARAGRARPWLLGAAWIVLAVQGVMIGARVRELRARPLQEQRLAVLTSCTQPEDLVLFSDYASAFPMRALADRPVVVRMESREMLARAARAMRRHPLAGRIVLMIPVADMERMTWILHIRGLTAKSGAEELDWPGTGKLLVLTLDRDRFRALGE